MIGKIIARVRKEITGRLAYEKRNVDYLLEAVHAAGDGDYLEIGVMHGGSLCAVAMLKQALGHKGRCIGIDPLTGYYKDRRNAPDDMDIKIRVPISLATVQENIRRFDLDNVEIITEKSYPMPVSGEFAACYIDGDHWGDGPLRDWLSVKDMVTGYVVFDNDEPRFPDVTRACEAAIADPDWMLHLRAGVTCVVRRIA